MAPCRYCGSGLVAGTGTPRYGSNTVAAGSASTPPAGDRRHGDLAGRVNTGPVHQEQGVGRLGPVRQVLGQRHHLLPVKNGWA